MLEVTRLTVPPTALFTTSQEDPHVTVNYFGAGVQETVVNDPAAAPQEPPLTQTSDPPTQTHCCVAPVLKLSGTVLL